MKNFYLLFLLLFFAFGCQEKVGDDSGSMDKQVKVKVEQKSPAQTRVYFDCEHKNFAPSIYLELEDSTKKSVNFDDNENVGVVRFKLIDGYYSLATSVEPPNVITYFHQIAWNDSEVKFEGLSSAGYTAYGSSIMAKLLRDMGGAYDYDKANWTPNEEDLTSWSLSRMDGSLRAEDTKMAVNSLRNGKWTCSKLDVIEGHKLMSSWDKNYQSISNKIKSRVEQEKEGTKKKAEAARKF